MNYINTHKRRLVNSVNQLSVSKLDFDYAVTDKFTFKLFDKTGKELIISQGDLFYMAGKTSHLLTDTPCFLCDTFTLEDNAITFTVDTYTAEYLAKVIAPDTVIYIEIGRKTTEDETYKVILKEEGTAQERIYVPGLPIPFVMGQYYDTGEIDNLLAGKVDKVTGKVLSSNDYTAAEKTKVGKILTDGSGSIFLANDGTYKNTYNNGLEYYVNSGLDIVFSPAQTIYIISPVANNIFTFNATGIPAGTAYTCELWVNLAAVVTFTLPTIEKWLDGSAPVFSLSGLYWLALRYYNGKWYGNVMMRPE